MIPYTDHECRLVLDELYCGDKIVIPSSIEHAEFMIQVAQKYIDQQHTNTINALKADYGTR
jgi:hypothetical protein